MSNSEPGACAFTVGADGWCVGARHYPTEHCDARPDGTAVTLLVVHNISLPAGRWGTPHVSDLFTGRLDYNADPAFAGLRGVRVSSHFLIRRDGRVIQYVSGNERAWHAGQSCFAGRDKCNDFSLGIELEGSDTAPFEDAQYAALAALTLPCRRATLVRCARSSAHRTGPQDRPGAVVSLGKIL